MANDNVEALALCDWPTYISTRVRPSETQSCKTGSRCDIRLNNKPGSTGSIDTGYILESHHCLSNYPCLCFPKWRRRVSRKLNDRLITTSESTSVSLVRVHLRWCIHPILSSVRMSQFLVRAFLLFFFCVPWNGHSPSSLGSPIVYSDISLPLPIHSLSL